MSRRPSDLFGVHACVVGDLYRNPYVILCRDIHSNYFKLARVSKGYSQNLLKSCVKKVLYTTKSPTYERGNKINRDCKPL